MHPCWKAPCSFSRTRDSWLVKNFSSSFSPSSSSPSCLAYPPPRFGDYRPTIRHFSARGNTFPSLGYIRGCTLINKITQQWSRPLQNVEERWVLRKIQRSCYTNVSLTSFVLFFFHVSPSIYTRWRVLTCTHVGLIISRAVCRAKKEKDTFEIEIVRFQRERNLI